jgi:hypothetical protein
MNLAVHGLEGDIREGISSYDDPHWPPNAFSGTNPFAAPTNASWACPLESEPVDPRLLRRLARRTSLIGRQAALDRVPFRVAEPSSHYGHPSPLVPARPLVGYRPSSRLGRFLAAAIWPDHYQRP